MTPASENLLVACIDDVRAGRLTIEDCIAEHPEIEEALLRLAPLLQVAQTYSDSDHDLQDDGRQRIRAGLRAAMGVNGHDPSESRKMIEDLGRKPWLAGLVAWPFDRLATFGNIITAHAALLPAIGAGVGAALAGGAVVYAAQTASPESPLYPVRQAVHAISESLGQAGTPSPTPEASPTPSPTLEVTRGPLASSDDKSRFSGLAGREPASEAADRERDRETRSQTLPPGGQERGIVAASVRGDGRISGNAGRPSVGASSIPPQSRANGDGGGGGGPLGGTSDGGRNVVVASPSPSSRDGGSQSTSGSGGSPSPSASSSSRDGGSPSASPSSSSHDGGSASPSAQPTIVASSLIRSSSPSPSPSSGSSD